MTVTTILLLAGGLVLLVVGAEALVRGASRLAAALGIAPLMIGLTIVAFGTSSPEMAVSVQSALSGQTDIAVGNVVGSNIFNVLFILGVSALITPLLVAQQLVRLDVPIMIGVSVVLLLMALNGVIEQWEGAVLFAGIIGYTIFQIVQSRKGKETAAVEAEVCRGIWQARAALDEPDAAQYRDGGCRIGAAGAGGALVCGWGRPVGAGLWHQRGDHRVDDRGGGHVAARGGHVTGGSHSGASVTSPWATWWAAIFSTSWPCSG